MSRKKQIKNNRRDSRKPRFKQIAYAAAVLLLLIGTIVLSIVIDKSSPIFTISIDDDLTEDAAKQLCQQIEEKPYIGDNPRELNTGDMKKAVRINRTAEVLMVILVAASIVVRSIW